MGNTRGRTGLARVWAIGAVGAALAVLAPGTATAAPTAHADRLERITCESLVVNGTVVIGYDCDTDQLGLLEEFSLVGRGGRVFRCETGWSEAGLWASGEDCRRAR
ncbi:hypothetical protein ACQPZF_20510 [Actinosynnema sp. CS-041913]|uniref:hypothetical protein n=1 Tax=Actinosynnema sp. CS-041913 TaxID=3239917 RepID=UPI003D8CEAA0